MKKTIRIMSILLALIITVLPLVGCSEAELGYMQMLMSAGQKGCFESSEEIVIDFHDALAQQLLEGIVSPEEYPENITFKIDGKGDNTKAIGAYDLKLSCGNLVSFSAKYFVGEDKVAYVSNIDYKIDPRLASIVAVDTTSDEELFVMSHAFSSLKNVKPSSATGAAAPADDSYATQLADLLLENADESLAIYTNFIKSAFSGYTTGAVTKIENGYELKAGIEDIVKYVQSFVDYLNANTDSLDKAVVAFAKELAGLAEKKGNTELKEILLAVADELANAEPNAADVTDLYLVFPTVLENIKNIAKGTKLYAKTYEKDGKLVTETETDIVVEGVIFVTIKSTQTIASCDSFSLTQQSKESAIPLTDLIVRLANGINYAENSTISEMRITWSGTEGTSEVYGDVYGDTSGEYALGLYDFHNIDGSMYLPMRRICERFGEVVDWDPVEGRAYVVRGDQKIDMTGVIIDSRTFIKIRDFEKLGYFVDYKVDEAGRPWAILNCESILG